MKEIPSVEEFNSAESMMTDSDREMSEQREKEWHEKKFETALNEVCERYPELADKIKTSLDTPQLGEHHNEGPKMKAHLSLILETLESIRERRFHGLLQDRDLQDAMRDIAIMKDPHDPEKLIINPVLVDYTFFHDISKPDCITLKIDGEADGVEITWEEWQEIEKGGAPYQHKGKPVKSISYYHKSEGSAGQHGNKAVEMLKGKGLPPEITVAIGKHEVAYQFAKINAETYEEHFVKTGFSEYQQQFILIASYIDTMASLNPDGKPDMNNFANLVKSRNNLLLINQYVDGGANFRNNDLVALKRQNRVLTTEDVERIIVRQEKYNSVAFAERLDTLVSGGQISVEEKTEILATVFSSPKELGKKFGPKMKLIRPLLEQSRE